MLDNVCFEECDFAQMTQTDLLGEHKGGLSQTTMDGKSIRVVPHSGNPLESTHGGLACSSQPAGGSTAISLSE